MIKRPYFLSIHPSFIGKCVERANQSSSGWQNVNLTHSEMEECITKGYAHGHQWHQGRRNNDNFQTTTVITVDLDKGLVEVEDFIKNEFVKQNASFVYTSSSHTDEHHRYHALFTLPIKTNSGNTLRTINRGLYKKLANEFKIESYVDLVDASVETPSSFIFGNPNSLKLSQDVQLSYSLVDQIQALGSSTFSTKKETATPSSNNHIDPEHLVELPNHKFAPLNSLLPPQKICCPYHDDDKPSAFVIKNSRDVLGIHCRVCNNSWFVGPTPKTPYDFYKLDRIIQKNDGVANTNFQYEGLTQIYPELETSPYVSNYHVINQKHLQYIPRESGIHLIKSAKGTGKTTALIDLVNFMKFPPQETKETRKPIILIGHRQALLKEISERLGLDCYLDTANNDKTLERTTKNGKTVYKSLKPTEYAICLDSLESRMMLEHESYPVVIIDESEQVFSHFLSESMKRPIKNFETLSKLISKASHVYCLDADLGETTVEGILACIQQHKSTSSNREKTNTANNIHFYLNEYKKPAGEIKLIGNQHQLYGDIYKSLEANKKCFITSNSKRIINVLSEALSNSFPNKKFLTVTSDNSGDEDIREYVKNIKNTVLECDAIFSSPSLGTGIDITYDHDQEIVDCVYGLFQHTVNNHFDIDQQLGRVRHPKQVKVWINHGVTEHITSPHVIKQNLLDEYDVPMQKVSITSDGIAYNESSSPFFDLLTKVRQIRYESQNNFFDNFINYKKIQGWTVEDTDVDDLLIDIGVSLQKKGLKLFKDEYSKKILSAPLITSNQYQELEEKRKSNYSNDPITSYDRILIDKYWLHRIYKQDITQELLNLDDFGNFRVALRIYEVLTHSEFQLMKSRRDINDITLSNLDVISDNFDIAKQKALLLRSAFEAAGIYKDGLFLDDAIWHQDSLSDFILLCKDTYFRADISRLFNKDVHTINLSSRASTQLHDFLKLVGLKNVQVTRNRGKGKSINSYKLCPTRLSLIRDIASRRVTINNELNTKTNIENGGEYE